MEPQPAKAAGAARLSSLLAQGRRGRHPPTLHMVLEALQAQGGQKGTSVVAIKRFILAKYPAVDPVRLKYLLKRALATGLSRGFLVRPHNSSALGATGRFKVSGAAGRGAGTGTGCSHALPIPRPQLAPKKLQQKQKPSQEDPGEGPAPKLGLRAAAKAARAPAVVQNDRGQGAAKEKPKAVKKQPRAKPADAQPAVVVKPRKDGVKAPRAPAKGRSGPPAVPAAKGVRGDSGDRSAGAGVKRPQKTPAAKSKGKVPEEAQEAASNKGGKGRARKPQAALGASQREEARAQEAAPGRKVS
ncbi:histone H1oo isoform X1 [Numida meleagris]|uniref:histone H1oo isoform X1 n=1 Tax=Numida meleagris TaxID=8996 RepID=UPI000B3DCA52|nr:histone H1oo isoform X1 [Numida meleagris]